MNKSILIVEDEAKIARVLQLELEFEGYKVTLAQDGYEGLESYRSGDWDLILLDIMIPGFSGVELLRRIRTHDSKTPVILLTAKASVEDKVSGLDLGANDYITKPFQMEELLARVRATLRMNANRNGTKNEDDWINVHTLKVNELTREVYREENLIDLTPREFDLLVYLMKNKKQVLTRDQILTAVWGYDYLGETNVVDVYIRYLRKKIDQNFSKELIHTVRGVGYVLKES